jgi:hypothetical protein
LGALDGYQEAIAAIRMAIDADNMAQCLYITYQSVEDWTEARDTLRCNSDFHGCERYDCVIINEDSPGLTIVRLRLLLRCRLTSGKVIDMALVCSFDRDNWIPALYNVGQLSSSCGKQGQLICTNGLCRAGSSLVSGFRS